MKYKKRQFILLTGGSTMVELIVVGGIICVIMGFAFYGGSIFNFDLLPKPFFSAREKRQFKKILSSISEKMKSFAKKLKPRKKNTFKRKDKVSYLFLKSTLVKLE